MSEYSFFFFKEYEININDIKEIEMITIIKNLRIIITVKGPREDRYKLIMKNGDIYEIPSYYYNKNRTLGRYLSEVHQIKKKEMDKYTFSAN
ncbi:hypothetical protein [Chengkuizengella sediminis]|uniref:hypothetical protein n=1 Tax=Chengkuizengella sediminis TaxID=1885917 RepID=UPI00138A484A|nr:hypothetical protein [Chengkuizengella sediminis]NDI34300.1 hypothetical protein [Chengkuizengella sediminis]